MKKATGLAVGLIQVKTERLNLAANHRRALALIRKAASRGARLVVTPECMLDGYAFDSAEFQASPDQFCVESGSSALLEDYQALAEELGIFMVIGASLREARSGTARYRNAAVVINPNGAVIATYAKMHSTYGNLEATFYAHGTEAVVFPVPTEEGEPVQCGIMICYDRQVPETARLLAIRGAQIILNPVATGNFARGWNTRLMQTRAYENKAYVVSVNHAWPRINGRSLVVSPAGRVIYRAPPWECAPVVVLHPEVYVAERAHALGTRRPSIYGDLLRPGS